MNKLILMSLLLVSSTIFISSSVNSLSKEDGKTFGKEYFPTDIKNKLIYDSSFGELELKISKENTVSVFNLDSEKFKYMQKIFVTDDGYYVTEMYQKVKLLLFITKEGKYVYDHPLLRVPLPVKIGDEWTWKGKEFVDDETHTVNVKGKALAFESITVPAGKYDALEIQSTLETSKGSKNILTEWYAENLGMVKMKVEIQGGGILGFARDVLGYGEIIFDLKEIRNN